MGGTIRFLLNDTEISLTEAGSRDTLLDFLRLNRRLTGTKEGCAEGDCGACTVLVGRLHHGRLHYEPINACIRFLASCHGCHVVTVEHLRGPQGLHPVQAAMVEHHGSQCGFCTPGFVMALYGLWMQNPRPDMLAVETALQGNLCRCTGYEPIVKAAFAASQAGGQNFDALTVERDRVTAWLADLPRQRVTVSRGDDRAILPADAADLAQVLAENPKATIVAGATDVGLWVTKFLRDISPAVFIGHLQDLKHIQITPGQISIGAGVTYSEFEPFILQHFPEALDYWRRIGGWQVRNAGTIGGNVANGSPIGETPPLLIALGATMTLCSAAGTRDIAVEDFFIDYGKQDRRPGEFVQAIHVPLRGDARIAAYKVSKRHHADITASAAAFHIETDGATITDARVAFGGMAATPKRAANAEAALRGQPFSAETFEAAAHAVANDFTPLSDWRASAEYRQTLAANFFRRFWLEQSGQDHRLRRVE
ncbi:xanthine dehydrogenase small subunit [Paracoccus shanxieyensis]|uniref:Xanthine dehydrogenase small subunit n=1 Tax=Paracoccus shanxieyensis TaxID=2675752 RepID=A0A6L6IW48_9RHOB|nr:xanthine dehydrogenase small subunit [Paracoccus shanxieyensis]MTH63828.1 xanthine dehydrogenase small subunit [Paracoccus shanxieyensis]MTH86661.1 xanthine dehydrogenase small subunit [Paracoccus shanxieyensis]